LLPTPLQIRLSLNSKRIRRSLAILLKTRLSLIHKWTQRLLATPLQIRLSLNSKRIQRSLAILLKTRLSLIHKWTQRSMAIPRLWIRQSLVTQHYQILQQ
jgi:hypothetical protein